MKTPITFLVLFLFFQNFLHAQEPQIAISDQMNVIYIGIDNPVTIAVEGYPSEHFYVSSNDVEVTKLEDGKYNFIATRPGKAIIKVQPRGKALQEIEYRVKRIPDPVARLGMQSGGAIKTQDFHQHKGVFAYLQSFDLGKCEISGYEITVRYKDENRDPVAIINLGQEYTLDSQQLIETTSSGDIVYFDNIKARCPGDPAGRKINSMIFKIRD